MRKCFRCGEDMLENCYHRQNGQNYGIIIKQDVGKLFGGNLGEPDIAVCPSCGEISWFVPVPARLKK